jgi:hypothetical protein
MGDPDLDPDMLLSDGDPAGSRVTLSFADRVPELTPEQLRALLAPLISFDIKSAVQAFTDPLPQERKDAILAHNVLVGMTTDMVLFAKGHPDSRVREMDGQMPFEEWIYGKPPEEVDFVRINGNRVIREEIARDGEPLEIFTKDVVTPMMMTGGNPEVLAQANTRTVREGDVETDPSREAPKAPPTLRNPGETLPTDNTNVGVMRPVQFPKPHQDTQPGANPDEQQSQPPAQSQPAQPASYPQPAPQTGTQQPPANATQPQSTPAQAPPAGGSQTSPSAANQLVAREFSPQPND